MVRRAGRLLLASGLLLGGLSNPVLAQDKEVVIGVATAMTGTGAATGQQIAAGVKLAVDEVNAAGGINGVTFKLLVEDDRTQPGGSVNAFNKLASMEPAVVVGPTFTNFMLTLAPIIQRAEIPVFTSAGGTKLTDPDVSGGWIFRAAPPTNKTIQSLIDYAAANIAPKRAVILYSNDEWGKSGYDAFKNAGFEFVAAETFNFGDKDVSAQVLKLKAANPDAVVIWNSLPAEAGLITNQLRQFMPDTRIICGQACAVDEYYDLAKAGGEGVLTVAPWVPGLNPESEDWAARLKANDPQATVSYTSAESYDAAMIAMTAIAGLGEIEPGKVREAIAGVKDHKGIVGTYSFDERGDGLHGGIVVEWANGVMKLAGTN
jgi:branched-chain amino acid transport system substrate-binding protein